MTQFDLPIGRSTALIGVNDRLSFDDVATLKTQLQRLMASRFSAPPRRILGCLEDSLGSLMALLACPEVSEYMPVNPRLLDREVVALARDGWADAAILSKGQLHRLGPMLTDLGCDVILWDTLFEEALGQMSGRAAKTGGTSFWPDQPRRLILHTSGTTGSPKRVPISIPAMIQSARNIARLHELQSDDLALNTLPTFHIGAVVDVLMAPFLAQGAVALTDGRSPQALAAAIRDIRPTWVQLVPTILMHLIEKLDDAELRDLGASLRFVRNISAPVPAPLRARAEELLGCPIIEMYGMTETAGQITTNGRTPKDRRAGTVGRETAVPIKLLDGTGAEVGEGRNGEICVSGPTVFEGYEGVPRGDVFFGDWFRTGDLGTFDEDGFLSIRGRLKEMINIGGEKVSPSEVETIALTHPDVKEAAAYAVSHDTLGETVGLTIAVRQPVNDTDFLRFLATSIGDFKLPRRIRQVDELPRLPNAKVDRLKIARDAATVADSGSPDGEMQDYPKSSVERKVADLWREHLKSRQPEGPDDFFDMGGDSLSATGFLIDLSAALGRTVSPTQLFATPTFEGIVAAVSKQEAPPVRTQARSLRFVADKMAGWPGQVALENGLFRGVGTIQNGTPLFWCTQSVRETNDVLATFGARRPLYVVRSLFKLSGKSIFSRNKRSSDDFEVLTRALVKEINIIQPDGPLCIGGFCGGGMVMERVARALMDGGRDVKLFVSLDYWPSRPFDCAVVHGMSESSRNSPRKALFDVDVSLPALHPHGALVLNSPGDHSFGEDHFATEGKQIARLIDADVVTVPSPAPAPDSWTYKARSRPPALNIISNTLPRFYAPGATHDFTVTIKNLSDQVLAPFDQSGLALDLTLYNLDGCLRDQSAGIARLTEAVEPGQTATFNGSIRFPDKAVPLLISGQFKSHGIACAHDAYVANLRRLVFRGRRRK